MTRSVMREQFDAALEEYEATNGGLPGIALPERRAVLVEQLVESARRRHYFEVLKQRPRSPATTEPNSASFSPIRASIMQQRAGNRDEAFWLVFLFVHFGKHPRSAWRLIADVYGRLGDGGRWSWDAVAADVVGFRQWLDAHVEEIKSQKPRRGFGNHRKYESLGAWNDNGTGAVVASYVDWVGPGGHDALIAQVTAGATTPTARFDKLHTSVQAVRRFGRTAAFDYCATLGKVGLAVVEPSAACLAGATGPLYGARLLVCEPGRRLAPSALEEVLALLQEHLGVGFDVLEDALCNWQKNPNEFKPFRG